MTVFPAVLILLSCFTHAGWNLLARHRRDEVTFFRRMLLLIVPMAGVVVGAGLALPHSFPPVAWACVVISGAICGSYFWFLALAYRSSDFTIVYPVARALPVLIVAAIDVLRGRYPSAVGWLAMIIVTAGCVLAPQQSLRKFDLKRYHLRELVWILLTAATIAGFTMLDKVAQEAMLQGPGSALLYCGVWHVFAALTYLALHRGFADPAPQGAKVGWWMPLAAGILGLASYTLVLWAFQMATQTGYLLAFRQFSIVIGVVAAFIIHRERGAWVRLPATAAIVGALALLILHG